jgi:hypothetical protein
MYMEKAMQATRRVSVETAVHDINPLPASNRKVFMYFKDRLYTEGLASGVLDESVATTIPSVRVDDRQDYDINAEKSDREKDVSEQSPTTLSITNSPTSSLKTSPALIRDNEKQSTQALTLLPSPGSMHVSPSKLMKSPSQASTNLISPRPDFVYQEHVDASTQETFIKVPTNDDDNNDDNDDVSDAYIMPTIMISGWLFCGFTRKHIVECDNLGVHLSLRSWAGILDKLRAKLVDHYLPDMSLTSLVHYRTKVIDAPRCKVCVTGVVRNREKLAEYKAKRKGRESTLPMIMDAIKSTEKESFRDDRIKDNELCLACLMRKDLYQLVSKV